MKKNIEHRPLTLWGDDFEITPAGDIYRISTDEYLTGHPAPPVKLETMKPNPELGEYYTDEANDIGVCTMVCNPEGDKENRVYNVYRIQDLVDEVYGEYPKFRLQDMYCVKALRGIMTKQLIKGNPNPIPSLRHVWDEVSKPVINEVWNTPCGIAEVKGYQIDDPTTP